MKIKLQEFIIKIMIFPNYFIIDYPYRLTYYRSFDISTMNNTTIDKISIFKFQSQFFALVDLTCSFKKFPYYTLNLIPSPYFEGTKWD